MSQLLSVVILLFKDSKSEVADLVALDSQITGRTHGKTPVASLAIQKESKMRPWVSWRHENSFSLLKLCGLNSFVSE
jgi:hypothetical protein